MSVSFLLEQNQSIRLFLRTERTPGLIVGEVMQKKRPTRGTPMMHQCIELRVGGAVLYVKQPLKLVLGLPSRL